MAFNVTDMLAKINAVGGLSRASKFVVRITPPSALVSNINDDFTFLCESASLPGLSFQTDDIRMSGYGNIEKRPYAPIFQDVNLTFYNDSDGRVLSFFHKWQQSIYNFSGRDPFSTTQNLVYNSFAYPKGDNGGMTDGYYGIVDIIHYGENTSGSGKNIEVKELVSYQLIEAFPISIGDIQVDWNMNDQLVKVPVTFAYTYWTSDTLAPSVQSEISTARATSLTATENKIDARLKSITELLNISSAAQVNRYTNKFAQRLF